ncbi:MAG: hypothetical protein ACK45H_05815, partial [Bacteroidota bacterium]
SIFLHAYVVKKPPNHNPSMPFKHRALPNPSMLCGKKAIRTQSLHALQTPRTSNSLHAYVVKKPLTHNLSVPFKHRAHPYFSMPMW